MCYLSGVLQKIFPVETVHANFFVMGPVLVLFLPLIGLVCVLVNALEKLSLNLRNF